MFICKICNKKMKSFRGLSSHINRVHDINKKEYYDKFLKNDDDVTCFNCGNETKFSSFYNGYNKFCSKKCSGSYSDTKEKRKNTNLEKYGFENPSQLSEVKQKKKDTFVRNYNVSNCFKSEEIKEKIRNTNLEKYGFENPLQSEEIKEKIRNTNLEKYGFEWGVQSDKIKEKIRNTNFSKFGFEVSSKSQIVKDKNKHTRFLNFIPKLNKIFDYLNIDLLDKEYINNTYLHNWKCTKCENVFTKRWQNIQQGYRCQICFPSPVNYSKGEKEVYNFIKEECKINNIIENSREIISPKELDLFLPDYDIGIEFNGLYWHSNKFLDIDYHIEKTEFCGKKGIRLIHIFEDEWLFKKDIVKQKIKQILKISNSIKINARDCIIKEIDPKTKNKFLDKYHLQGKDNSTIKLGAFYKNELVSVMTFSTSNISRSFYKIENIYELSRFCSDYNYHIPGIASKLLTYFERNYEWKEIFTYADKRWSDGNLYYKLNFQKVHDTKPNYWYIKDFKRIHRFSLRKNKNDPKDIPEWVLRESEGYFRIWDCGNIKFKLTSERTNI